MLFIDSIEAARQRRVRLWRKERGLQDRSDHVETLGAVCAMSKGTAATVRWPGDMVQVAPPRSRMIFRIN